MNGSKSREDSEGDLGDSSQPFSGWTANPAKSLLGALAHTPNEEKYYHYKKLKNVLLSCGLQII